MDVDDSLIFDLGASDGDDTAYYLAKGFCVVAVEADPVACAALRRRFRRPIAEGRVTLVHAAVAATAGQTVSLWRYADAQHISSLDRRPRGAAAGAESEHKVTTIDWAGLVALRGVPRYCKVDVEGAECAFLSSIPALDQAPEYLSAECKVLRVAQARRALGYRRFKLVDQKIFRAFPVPDPPLEGRAVVPVGEPTSSGPFGRELPGPWIGYDELAELWALLRRLQAHPATAPTTWYDCHAWAPREGELTSSAAPDR